MDLKELRGQIDEIDDQLVSLFCRRMDIAAQVADYKKANGLPILVPGREREILQEVSQKAGPEMAAYTRTLYSMVFELSRSYQNKRNGGNPSSSPRMPWWPARAWREPTPSWPARKFSKTP